MCEGGSCVGRERPQAAAAAAAAPTVAATPNCMIALPCSCGPACASRVERQVMAYSVRGSTLILRGLRSSELAGASRCTPALVAALRDRLAVMFRVRQRDITLECLQLREN